MEGKKKGYSEKWSRSVHIVKKKIRIVKNEDVFKYFIIGQANFFWRHELLKIRKVDDKVPKTFELKEKIVYEEFRS